MKKQPEKTTQKSEIAEAFALFCTEKDIKSDVFEKLFKEVIVHLLGKKFGTEDIAVVLNAAKGNVQFFRQMKVVEDGEVTDPDSQIEVSKAQEYDEDLEVDDNYSVLISKENISRREIVQLHQNLKQKIQEYQNNNIYKKYADKIGDLVNAAVYQTNFKEIITKDEEQVELILPKTEMIPGDVYRKGDVLHAVVHQVLRNPNGSSLQIILSRTSPVFLEKLLEQEVPEVYDGLIAVKKIVREPGERAKVAVESYSERIDPVGTVVGVKGQRIHSIVRELRNESIDVINWTTNAELLIIRALNPAKIINIKFDEAKKTADVIMRPDQISLAIGKGGHNIKLAGKLAGYDISVYRDYEDSEEDVDLQEFADVIDQWMIDELVAIGCDTAKDVLALSNEELDKRTQLEIEQIQEIRNILEEEFK
jgi:N utilization substance protein A